MIKIILILGICAFSFIPISAQAIRKTTCTKERYFKALVTKDPHTKKGSVNTFSKTNAGDFWFWHEKRMLINPGISPQPTEDACKWPNLVINRELSLKDGIVKTEAEVNTSSYLVSEDWAGKAIFYAVMQGETIRVTKPK